MGQSVLCFHDLCGIFDSPCGIKQVPLSEREVLSRFTVPERVGVAVDSFERPQLRFTFFGIHLDYRGSCIFETQAAVPRLDAINAIPDRRVVNLLYASIGHGDVRDGRVRA